MRKSWVLTLVSLLGLVFPALGASRYQVIALCGEAGKAYAINNRSQVVVTANGTFLWEKGSLREISSKSISAHGINNLGQVVGEYHTSSDNTWHGYVLQDGSVTDVGDLGGRKIGTYASGINDHSEVVGKSETPALARHAFLWKGGSMQDLGVLPGDTESHAKAINHAHVAVGWSMGGGVMRPVLWQGKDIIDLVGFPGFNSQAAQDINDLGQVLGRSVGSGGNSHTWIKQGNQIRELAQWWNGLAINNHGQVVGWPAYIWENNKFANLNDLIPADSGWHLDYALDINDLGEIVGYGTYQGKEPRAFLLTPKNPGGGLPPISLLLLEEP